MTLYAFRMLLQKIKRITDLLGQVL